MKIIAENTDQDIARHHAQLDVEESLRQLSANLLRVIRGAGRPHEIGKQCEDLTVAWQNYREAAGVWPSGELVAASLELETPPWVSGLGEHEAAAWYGKRTLTRGVLQMVASELLDQRTQQTAGEHEMYTGLNEITRAREAQRRQPAPKFTQRARKAPGKPKREPKA